MQFVLIITKKLYLNMKGRNLVEILLTVDHTVPGGYFVETIMLVLLIK